MTEKLERQQRQDREGREKQKHMDYLQSIVDHGRDMAAAGVPGFAAWTLVFGNPAAGARLLARDLAAAVDIPLRLAVVAGEASGSEIVLREMGSLLAGDLGGLADAFTAVLRAIAEQARDLAQDA